MMALSDDQRIFEVEQILEYSFKDPSLLKAALTHPSAVEQFDTEEALLNSYERLEFLGDSVLGYLVSKELFKRFPHLREGALTRLKVSLVSGTSLSALSQKLGLGKYIVFGNSETGTNSRGLQSALENVFESLVGALVLDGGIEVAEQFVYRVLEDDFSADRVQIPESYKSLLQEVVQRDTKLTPSYKLLTQDGPPHEPVFTCGAYVGDELCGSGEGKSKKEAENAAARSALEQMGIVNDRGECITQP